MLKTEDLWVSVGDRQVLKGVNFSMNYGEINVLFGPNGAGKTTFMMTLMGFPRYKIEQGKIYFKGEDITGQDIYEGRSLASEFLSKAAHGQGREPEKNDRDHIQRGRKAKSIDENIEKLNLADHLEQGTERWFFRRRDETFRASSADGTKTGLGAY